MLQIQTIQKQYITGELVQTALAGVSLNFRDNEFVAILGPSGSGKTTLLNIIGGLDRYDSGDLIINGISTKKYSDRDWDSYRNHTIGFVFQSYNLIPHQTVLSNVELALTISGISRSERRKRATKALEDVGLGDQLHKRPNQMSGGQMQRVAIARALVNNPSILLADEPTGALDSDTSIQVMELLKEVSRERLVIMVTHNPELAENYANRIVRVRDGKIVDDSNPYIPEIQPTEKPKHTKTRRVSMSYLTALGLSYNNLRTKKGRTILTSFAGSIGIIGIALILSLSTGFQKYIDKLQEETLSNYPLSIQSETADITTAMAAFGAVLSTGEDAEPGTVVEQQMMAQMFAQVGTNDLSAFKEYLDENVGSVEQYINDIKYGYSVRPLIYRADTDGGVLQVNPGNLFGAISAGSPMSAYMDTNVFYEMIDNIDLLDSQYDVLQGRWPQKEDEMILVLSSPGQIADYMAYTIGLKDTSGLYAMMEAVMRGENVTNVEEQMQWTYDELMDLEFCLVPSAAKYRFNEEYRVWEDMSSDQAYMSKQIANGQPLYIVGIVCPKEGVNATCLSAGIAYTSELTRSVIQQAAESEIVMKQLSDPQTDVFTGNAFTAEEEHAEIDFENMISVDEQILSSAFNMNIDQDAIVSVLENYLKNTIQSLNVDLTPAKNGFINTFSVLSEEMLTQYVSGHMEQESGVVTIQLTDIQDIAEAYLALDNAQEHILALEKEYRISSGTLLPILQPLLVGQLAYCVTSNIQIPSNPELPDLPDDSVTDSLPETEEDFTQETQNEQMNSEDKQFALYATITIEDIPGLVSGYADSQLVSSVADAASAKMMEPTIRRILSSRLSNMGTVLMQHIGNAFSVDADKLSQAFQFNMNEEDLLRLMNAMSGSQAIRSAEENLRSLGYADTANPTSISVYFSDFAGKESFLDFLDEYNLAMEQQGREEQIIRYTDLTGIMMSSVRTIIDSVSYVLIAFVAVSLVVSSIMIGIITYISVMERTKEIGVLRAIGASKRNISQVFNAETFIIGFCSGLIGIGATLLFNIPINHIIFALTGNPNIQAQLPPMSAFILIALSMVLTLIGGLIPSKQAAKKDPVIALRSE